MFFIRLPANVGNLCRNSFFVLRLHGSSFDLHLFGGNALCVIDCLRLPLLRLLLQLLDQILLGVFCLPPGARALIRKSDLEIALSSKDRRSCFSFEC